MIALYTVFHRTACQESFRISEPSHSKNLRMHSIIISKTIQYLSFQELWVTMVPFCCIWYLIWLIYLILWYHNKVQLYRKFTKSIYQNLWRMWNISCFNRVYALQTYLSSPIGCLLYNSVNNVRGTKQSVPVVSTYALYTSEEQSQIHMVIFYDRAFINLAPAPVVSTDKLRTVVV